MSRESAVSPRRLTRGLLTAVLLSFAVGPVVAGDPPEPPVAPVAVSRAELESKFQELFTLTMEISRAEGSQERDALIERREALLAEIRKLKPEAEEWRIPDAEIEAEDLFDVLEAAAEEIDWDEVNALIAGSLEGIGQGMRELSEELDGLNIELGPDRIQLDTRDGDRVVLPIPPEIQDLMREGIGDIAAELDAAFNDSATVENNILELLDRGLKGIEGARGTPWTLGRDEPERRVIADSVFKVNSDFEVNEDEIVQGDIILITGDVYVGGEVHGSVITLFGDIWVDETGSLGKDAISVTGTVEVDGKVHGDSFALGEMVPGVFSSNVGGVGSLALVFHGSRVALQAVLLLLAFSFLGPRMTQMSEHSDQNLGRSLMAGSAWLVVALGGIAVAGIALVFTVIGIPIVFVLLLAFWAAGYGSYFVACRALGHRLMSSVKDDGGRAVWVAGLVGMAIFELPTFLYSGMRPIEGMEGPAQAMLSVDLLVKFLAVSLGFGALIATRGGAKPAPVAPGRLPSSVESGA